MLSTAGLQIIAAAALACAGGRMELDEFVGFDERIGRHWRLVGTVERGDEGEFARADVAVIQLDASGKRTERIRVSPVAVAGALPRDAEGIIQLEVEPLLALARQVVPRSLVLGDSLEAIGAKLTATSVDNDPDLQCRRRDPEARPLGLVLRVRGVWRQTEFLQIKRDAETGHFSVRGAARARVSPDRKHLLITVRGSRSESFHIDELSVTTVVALKKECREPNPAATCDVVLPWSAPNGGPKPCRQALEECSPELGEWACGGGGRCEDVGTGYRCVECVDNAACLRTYPGDRSRGHCGATALGARCGACDTHSDCAATAGAGVPRAYCDPEWFVCGECQTDLDCIALMQPDINGCPAMNFGPEAGGLGAYASGPQRVCSGSGRVEWKCRRQAFGSYCTPEPSGTRIERMFSSPSLIR